MSTTTRILSVEMERGSHQAAASYMQIAQAHYYYEALRSDEFAMLDRIRAGITNRAEWWSNYDGAAENAARGAMDAGTLNSYLMGLGSSWLERANAMGINGLVDMGLTAGNLHGFRMLGRRPR